MLSQLPLLSGPLLLPRGPSRPLRLPREGLWGNHLACGFSSGWCKGPSRGRALVPAFSEPRGHSLNHQPGCGGRVYAVPGERGVHQASPVLRTSYQIQRYRLLDSGMWTSLPAPSLTHHRSSPSGRPAVSSQLKYHTQQRAHDLIRQPIRFSSSTGLTVLPWTERKPGPVMATH